MTKQEFIVEMDGVIGTIRTYTRNPFMMGYIKELKRSIEHDDYDKIRIALDKLIEWYQEEYDNIKTDEYVFNKHMHEKAFHILSRYREALQS